VYSVVDYVRPYTRKLARSNLNLYLISFAVTFACLFLLLSHYRFGASSGHETFDWLGTVERALYDFRFRSRGPSKPSGQVGIVAIDDKTLARFGRWPLPREYYERMFLNLKAAKVRLVGTDVVFSEAQTASLRESIPELVQLFFGTAKPPRSANDFSRWLGARSQASIGDSTLASSVADFGNLVQGFMFLEGSQTERTGLLVHARNQNVPQKIFEPLENSAIKFAVFPKGQSLADHPQLMARDLLMNIGKVAAAPGSHAFCATSPDPDGIARSSSLVRGLQIPEAPGSKETKHLLLPSLSLAMASAILQRAIAVRFDDGGVDSIELRDAKGKEAPLNVPVLLDGSGRALINHYGREQTFAHYSFVDIYDNKIPSKLPPYLIIGATATGVNDIRPSPFSETFTGVEHHAAMLENILTRKFMQRPIGMFPAEILLLIVLAGFLPWAFGHLRGTYSAVFIVVQLGAIAAVDRWLLFGRGYWGYTGLFYLQSLATYAGIMAYRFLGADSERKEVHNMFEHYLSPAVISDLVADPSKLRLGGERRLVSIMFTDLQGFTDLTEKAKPELLTAILHEYFTPMTSTILSRNGLLDKYIGDAIMAFWNAPLAQDDHADLALRSAAEMLRELARLQRVWRQKDWPVLRMGIGINTGWATVGNMGSDQRFDYTAIGDAVNLASRVEALTRLYKVATICTGDTCAAVVNRDAFVFRELDWVRVKGRAQPVTVFEPVMHDVGNRDAVVNLAALFGAALADYRSQRWTLATDKFREFLKSVPDDGPAKLFLQRIELLRETPPGDDWNGLWVMKEK
jgi:adenylate cyclase